MSYLDVTHIAVNVPDLREAEAFYCALFDLGVAWRDSGGAASPFATWEELDAAHAQPEVIMLWRDVFKLALGAEPIPEKGLGALNHVGLQITLERLLAVRDRVAALGLPVLHSRGDELLTFVDRYGVQWELDTRSYHDPRDISRQLEERQRGSPPS